MLGGGDQERFWSPSPIIAWRFYHKNNLQEELFTATDRGSFVPGVEYASSCIPASNHTRDGLFKVTCSGVDGEHQRSNRFSTSSVPAVCGFHSYSLDLPDAELRSAIDDHVTYSSRRFSHDGGPWQLFPMVWAIEHSGIVVEHEYGYRSSRMRILTDPIPIMLERAGPLLTGFSLGNINQIRAFINDVVATHYGKDVE